MCVTRYFLLFALTAATSIAAADTAEDAFQKLFGSEWRRVQASRDGREKAAFARRLIEAADAVEADKLFQALIYTKATEIAGTHPEGFSIAIQAIDALYAAQPSLQGSLEDKAVSLLERQFRAATAELRKSAASVYITRAASLADTKSGSDKFDEAAQVLRQAVPAASTLGPERQADILRRIKDISAQQTIKRRIDDLLQRYSKSPDSKLAHELVLLYVVERQTPGDAARFLPELSDTVLAQMARLAANEVSALSEADALALGDWMKAQGATASEAGKVRAYRKAGECYSRFLSLHPTEDVQRLKVVLALNECIKLAPPRFSASSTQPVHIGKGRRLVNLLPLINSARDGLNVTVPWKTEKEDLVAKTKWGERMKIRYVPPDEYDFGVEFTSMDGAAEVAIIGARGNREFAWIMKNGFSGFEMVDNQPAEKNPTTTKDPAARLRKQERTTCVLEVRKGSITAIVNGQRVSQLKTDFNNLKTRPEWAVGGGMLGVGVQQNGHVLFHQIQLVEVTGEGKFVTPPAK